MGGTYQGQSPAVMQGLNGKFAGTNPQNSSAGKQAIINAFSNQPIISYKDTAGIPVPLSLQESAANVPKYTLAGNDLAQAILKQGKLPSNFQLPSTMKTPISRQEVATYPGLFGIGAYSMNIGSPTTFYQY